jgi:flavin-dependent dehydrogenase
MAVRAIRGGMASAMTHSRDDVFDVAVAGGGPAGAATARRLALKGWRVLLLERSQFAKPRIGESLTPAVQRELCDLGVWDDFLALQPLPSWGTASIWGEAAPQSHSHVFNPYGCGWHVNRSAFDQMLARMAASAGAYFCEGSTLRRSEYRGGLWQLQVTAQSSADGAKIGTMRARVLVDATGRSAHVARAIGAERIPFDHLMGIAMRWSGVGTSELGHLLVESAPLGWWYTAPLPAVGGQNCHAMIAMLMTDADLCRGYRLNEAGHWQRALALAQATKARLGSAIATSGIEVHYAHSHRLRRPAGAESSPWLAVGDAAFSVDPVSGSGVLRALGAARSAAHAVNELLVRPASCPEVLSTYEHERDQECTAHLLERAKFYAAEQRFETPFWQRRQVLGRYAQRARQ